MKKSKSLPVKNQAAQKETGFRTLTEVTLTKSVKYASEETQSPSTDEGVGAKKIPERSWCFLNSSLSSFAIKLAQKSTFLRFVIQSNETGHSVKDRLWTEADNSRVQKKLSGRTQMQSDTCHKRLASLRRRDRLPINATTQRTPRHSRCSTHAFTPQCYRWPLPQRMLHRSVITMWPIGHIFCVYICRPCVMLIKVWGDRIPISPCSLSS